MEGGGRTNDPRYTSTYVGHYSAYLRYNLLQEVELDAVELFIRTCYSTERQLLGVQRVLLVVDIVEVYCDEEDVIPLSPKYWSDQCPSRG